MKQLQAAQLVSSGRTDSTKILQKKVLDVSEKYDIIFISAIRIPRQLYYAQSTTGGRLGVRVCQM